MGYFLGVKPYLIDAAVECPTISASQLSPIIIVWSRFELVVFSACVNISRGACYARVFRQDNFIKIGLQSRVSIFLYCTSLNPFERICILYFGLRYSSNSMVPSTSRVSRVVRSRKSSLNRLAYTGRLYQTIAPVREIAQLLILLS